MNIHLNFTNKGQAAIANFNNDELLEIFRRYMNTLTKKYAVDVKVPSETNQSIVEDGVLKVELSNIDCNVDAFFRELGTDIKVPLKKRIGEGKLDNVFKAVQAKA
ncbi:hypothetical protein [Paenibacillus mucilaginosus]|uniref:Uncharacterized protein n=3 Tax=Paenibacillus mucilaginosus TaxID=61624 RepID=H6NTR3_9BACL|nr:hypothetical protein [Paenibacillus mucilaginosus]AEI39384.1 hypothetical protein KNP414_00794 [Paenibacillus mucilaginosus KNP414]AFC27657.1 hypothetical protein PM3016_697 [Paenibacillus mucilaginosus 3016]AFH59815.1 hypothetical protein B2K_03575 [Paenibacillus mucilaginosus K02]MCG7214773.1 hypothetical protein [Paenibacillus mucilaginosus]WDM28370.1 hypothetical protein KCX80_03765 [Paenibacillus mucilaginosus]